MATKLLFVKIVLLNTCKAREEGKAKKNAYVTGWVVPTLADM